MNYSMEEMNDSSANYDNSPFIEKNPNEEEEDNENHNEEIHSPIDSPTKEKNEILKVKTNEFRTSGLNITPTRTSDIKSGKGKNKINLNKYLIDTKTFANSLKEYKQEDLITSGKIGKINFYKTN